MKRTERISRSHKPCRSGVQIFLFFFSKILRNEWASGETSRSIKSRNFASRANFLRRWKERNREKYRKREREKSTLPVRFSSERKIWQRCLVMRNSRRRGGNHWQRKCWLKETRGFSNFIICFGFFWHRQIHASLPYPRTIPRWMKICLRA